MKGAFNMPIGSDFEMPEMTGTEEEVVKTSVAPKVTKSAKDNKIITEGKAEYLKMSDEEKELQGCKSGTLHFQNLIGLASRKDWRRVAARGADGSILKGEDGKVKDDRVLCLFPVGAEFISDEDIDVPVIPVECTPETGVSAEQRGTRHVSAGEKFALTQLEAMYLLAQPEYANACEFEGNPNGCVSVPKTKKFLAGQAKIPTPALSTVNKSVKSFTVQIDDVVRGEDGNVTEAKGVIAGYERFAYFLPKPQAPRATGVSTGAKKAEVSAQVITAAGIRKLLGI